MKTKDFLQHKFKSKKKFSKINNFFAKGPIYLFNSGQRVLGDSRDVQPLPQTLASFPEEGNQENIKKLRNTRDSVAHQRVLTRQVYNIFSHYGFETD